MFGRRFDRVLRGIAAVTVGTTTWFLQPTSTFAAAYHASHRPKPQSMLPKGETQTPDADLQKKIEDNTRIRHAKPDIRSLSATEMKHMFGRGPYRNRAFNGVLPWQRSFRDVNMCTGNLSKNFTDIQIKAGRGQGLALSRSYNSNDDREGPFGIGWTHVYDIRIEESGVNTSTGDDQITRTDFFGGKHTYTRDADGLYTPPPYLFDEASSNYDQAMANGLPAALEDFDRGMDGTVKHFVVIGTNADGTPNHSLRACDYIADRHGNQTNLTYGLTITNPGGSTQKLLTVVTDPVGRTLTFTWQNFGTTAAPHWRIAEVDGPGYPSTTGSYRVTYDYYTSATDPNAGGIAFQLKTVHLDPDGLNRTMTYTYTSYSDSGGTETGLLTGVVDSLGHTISYAYVNGAFDGNNNPSYPSSTGTLWVYRVTEPAGVDTASNPRTQIWYVRSGTWGGISSGFAVTLWSGTEAVGNLMVDPSLRKIGFRINSDYYLPRDYECAYDIANNVTDLHIASNIQEGWQDGLDVNGDHWEKFTYGPHGNVLTSSIVGFPSAVTTYTYYDASKYFQKQAVTDGNGHSVTYDYYDDQDPNVGNRGEAKYVHDAGYAVSGNPSYQKQAGYTYNQYGQRLSETNFNGVVTQYLYGDSWGNVTRIVQDPNNAATGYVGLARTTDMTYDSYGHVTQTTDPAGRTSTFSYNKLGQPVSAMFPAITGSSSESISYVYGNNGRTESVTDGRGTTTFSYETGSDRVSSVNDPVTGPVNYTYLVTGERSTVTLPGSTQPSFTFGYDTNIDDGTDLWIMRKDDPNFLSKRLGSITDAQGRHVKLKLDDRGTARYVWYDTVYDAQGQLVRTLKTSRTYDMTSGEYYGYSDTWTRFLLSQIQTVSTNSISVYPTAADQIVERNDYTYDNVGQRLTNLITPKVGSARTETYTYDQQNRLSNVNYGDGEIQTYTFDAMGNRQTKSDTISGTTANASYISDAVNRLTSVTSSDAANGSYTNDANGNVLAGGGRANTWDSQNRLVKTVKAGVTSAFTYGCDSLRHRSLVTKTDGTKVQTDYVYDNSMLLEEVVKNFDASGSQIGATSYVTYMPGPQGPLYRCTINTADARWYVYDGLGSVVGEVDVNGNLTGTKQYDVYGTTRGIGGAPTSRQGFVGSLGHVTDDETGLIYMRARYYDPLTGRFASEDPAGSGRNWYCYCADDPVNKVDETGKSPTELTMDLLLFLLNAATLATSEIFKRSVVAYLESQGDKFIARGEAELAQAFDEAAQAEMDEAKAEAAQSMELPLEMQDLIAEGYSISAGAHDSMAKSYTRQGVADLVLGYCAKLAAEVINDSLPNVGRN